MADMESRTIGSRIKEARNAANLSTRALAQLLKDKGYAVSHVTISKYERDEFSPANPTLQAIAEITGKELRWFETFALHLSGLRFRSLKTISAREKNAFSADALRWLRLYAHLHDMMHEEFKRDLQVSARLSDKGRELAKRVRETYKLKDYPIPSVSRMLENSGIRVIQLDGRRGIDAFAARLGEHKVVVVNCYLPPDRMRLTLAHELAHVLFEDCNHDRAVDHDDVEHRAFEFASHLLMPDSVLKDAFETKSLVRLVQYKERYGISLAAMVFRATRSNLISDRVATMLWREFSKLGWRKNEPGQVPTDKPARMEALLDSALRQDFTSLTELSCVSGLELNQLQDRILEALGARELKSEDVDAPSLRISAYRDEELSTE